MNKISFDPNVGEVFIVGEGSEAIRIEVACLEIGISHRRLLPGVEPYRSCNESVLFNTIYDGQSLARVARFCGIHNLIAIHSCPLGGDEVRLVRNIFIGLVLPIFIVEQGSFDVVDAIVLARESWMGEPSGVYLWQSNKTALYGDEKSLTLSRESIPD